ncbi:hypothetical protein KVR01_006260 [Diaporthe batatas]|uniref:uncharacterized protein n=1 Tax=Diaporthe batatas TaxID=748121 RepID=UPI001D05B947|nr:uncharacterized protein KVR01_006260 [Diaporthe batatas]KAG8164342.1 hypothetical protein KVR01_006260 [Diaporthe batatas]
MMPADGHRKDCLMCQDRARISEQNRLPAHDNLQPGQQILTRKTITYREVFENVQDKDSREKHYIVEWPRKSNKWYILRCDEHDLNFGEHPFTSARSHLYSEAHGFIERRANRSNMAYKKALADGYQPKGHGRKRRRKAGHGSKPAAHRPRPTHGVLRPAGTSTQFDGIIDPIPGEVYEGAQRQPGRSERVSVRGIGDGQEAARRFRARLEAYRASRGEPRLSVNIESDRTEAGTEDEGTSDTHDHSIAVAAASGTTGEHEANGKCPGGNGKDVAAREERDIHYATEDRILVTSSEHDESESSLSPVPSEYDGDEADSSYSSRSSSSDAPDASPNPTVVLEDFDIGDYNDPPISPTATSQKSANPGHGSHANDGSDEMFGNGSVVTPSAMESLRAIQVELIPGYQGECSSTVAQSTTPLERSDQLFLFPGLATRSTQEEG